jgi:predicted alpha/beta-hydrolase family hydrolase
MTFAAPRPIAISIDGGRSVSGLMQHPDGARICLVLAHGAGAGMAHPFMAAVAAGLAARGVATLRYQFPYMERGAKRPDSPAVAQAAVRAAVAEAARLAPGLALYAGGKSFGGRMSSQAQAESPLPGVRGLAFLGFPLHPPGKASDERGKHLSGVSVPMLFLQGTRDDFADLSLLRPLRLLADADHSFHVPARSGRKDPEVLDELLAALAGWMEAAAFG